MKPYSNDLREKIVVAYENNHYSQREVAALFGVSEATVKNILRRKRTTGSSAALAHGGGRQSQIDEAARAFLRQAVAAQNDATLAEYAEALAQQQHRPKVSKPTMCRVLKHLGLSRKKRRFEPVSNSPKMSNSNAKTTVRK